MKPTRWALLLGIASATYACGGNDSKDTGIGSGDAVQTGGTAGDTGLGGSGNVLFGNGGDNGLGGGGGSGGIPENQICGKQSLAAEAMPADLYVMFDQSSSMGDPLPDNTGNWWGAAQQAVVNFVNSPAAANAKMSVGIQYFPLNGVAPASCTADYSSPEVEIGALPANAGALTGSIQAHKPETFTPTGPALAGAIAHMKQWAPAHPGHAPVVVLVTDGFPTECDPQQIADIAQMAKDAFETEPVVRTYVIGFESGAGLENLDEIAKAGGSAKAFRIAGGDVGAQFVEAMLSIASTPLQCDVEIPKPESNTMAVDPNQVVVTYTPNATRVEEQVPRLNSLGDCMLNGNKGWYYDDPTTPTKILICPGTCAMFAAGVLKTIQGCEPIRGTTQ